MRTKLAQTKFPASSRIAIFFAGSALLFAAEMLPTHTPRFSDYPFDQWAATSERAAIKWEVHTLPTQLSEHQRLIQRIQAVVPGRELLKRRGRGELILLARFEDSDNRQWKAGTRMNLVNVEAGVKSSDVIFTVAAFMRPGDYKFSVALIDSETMEHSFTHRTLHIAPIKGDPLPDSWLGLPAVEVLPATDGSDSWYLPAIKDLLKLPLRPRQPAPAIADALYQESGRPGLAKIASARTGTAIPAAYAAKSESPHIDILVNTTPSQRFGGTIGALRRNMSMLIPSLKVLSGINALLHPPSAAIMDISRHRVGFETSNAAALDWNALGKALGETNPGLVDAKTLARESTMREYFLHEVAQRAGESGPPRWLIVMSGPFSFTTQDDTPIPVLPPDPNRHIVYLRFVPEFNANPPGRAGFGPGVQVAPPQRVHGPVPGLGTVIPQAPGRGRGGYDASLFPDDLERILKPMGAQVIVVNSPETFRKTVASLVDQISAN